ncbi:hypothetical protein ACTJIJ_14740 [Niabella sp. 22666]
MIQIPVGYSIAGKWLLFGNTINDFNDAKRREMLAPAASTVNEKKAIK